jgi:cytoplasmic iron level regulating protein YaaA (DUF328/UPF0246 family)
MKKENHHKKSKKELKNELDIQGNLLDRTYELYQNHSYDDETIPAIECYNGSSYKQIDLESYDKEQTSYMRENFVIISPMYGPLSSDMEIWPYRLEMRLKPNGIDLYDYWQEVIGEYFRDVDLIINLASNEYSKVVTDNYEGEIIDFYFKEEKEDGSLKSMGYYVKHNRGKLLNGLIKKQVESLNEIKKIEFDGYKFNEENSDENSFWFIKPYQK